MDRDASFSQSDEMGTDILRSTLIGIKSYPAITVLSPGLGYAVMLTWL